MLKRFLFETKIGEKALEMLEKKARLSLVDPDWLAQQESGTPTQKREAEPVKANGQGK